MLPLILKTAEDLVAWRADRQQRLALVPTMGCLHEGHASLIRLAQTETPDVLVSIFVNPRQFGPNEDFLKYPRTLQEDLHLLESLGVGAVFNPEPQTLYPHGFQTVVENRHLSDALCGASRPGHFSGVLTVVLKLFMLSRCDLAVFGKKDFQQLFLIESMVRDFNLPITIRRGAIVREPDGLAMSSRNAYLSADEREIAAQIYRGLCAAADAYTNGVTERKDIEAAFHRQMVPYSESIRVEYMEIRDSETMAVFSGTVNGPAIAMVAAKIGSTRLIDCMELS